jgi:hypothetical protein
MPRQHQPSFWLVWLLLLATLIVFAPAIFKMAGTVHWFDFGETPIKPNPTTLVWVAKGTGFYYCPDSALYGKASPGVPMKQADALAQGYQPAVGRYCR